MKSEPKMAKGVVEREVSRAEIKRWLSDTEAEVEVFDSQGNVFGVVKMHVVSKNENRTVPRNNSPYKSTIGR